MSSSHHLPYAAPLRQPERSTHPASKSNAPRILQRALAPETSCHKNPTALAIVRWQRMASVWRSAARCARAWAVRPCKLGPQGSSCLPVRPPRTRRTQTTRLLTTTTHPSSPRLETPNPVVLRKLLLRYAMQDHPLTHPQNNLPLSYRENTARRPGPALWTPASHPSYLKEHAGRPSVPAYLLGAPR